MSIQFIKQYEGYQVRVGPIKELRTKFFAVRKHGGKRKAFAAAEAAEAMLLKALPPKALHVRNTSGITGVRLQTLKLAGGIGRNVACSWIDRLGRARGTSFSAQKYGLLGALELAMRRREAETGVVYTLTPRQVLRRMKR